MEKRKVVMGLSGGMDSATLLGILLDEEAEVHCCHFQYGSKHNQYERLAVAKLVEFYREEGNFISLHEFDVTNLFSISDSSLLKSGGNIPEGHYEAETMKSTVVPGRNTIFASIMMSVAESVGAQEVALGVHSGDHHIYPDCRPNYILSLETLFRNATEGKVSVIAPFMDTDKLGILKLGIDLCPEVPYELTRTCYKNQPESCGKCGSCQERLEAFQRLSMLDPIKYETND